MNRFAVALLATTCLSGVGNLAYAGEVFENLVPFGSSSTSPTIVPLGSTNYVGNSDLTTASWFEIPAQTFSQAVQIRFTVAPIGAVISGSPVPAASLEGGSSLIAYPGTPVLTGVATGPVVTAASGGYGGASFPLGYQPALDLYQPSPGSSSGSPALFETVSSPDFSAFASSSGIAPSNSYAVNVTLNAGQSLPVSFSYDFDYTLTTQVAQVPEPATGLMLLPGLVALGAVRRRRRTSVL